MDLVKFSCGCIGFQPSGGRSLIIYECDGEGAYGFNFREINKTFVTLSEEDQGLHIVKLRDLINDGQKFKLIKSLLRG